MTTNLNSAIRPIFYFSRIFGLAPFSLQSLSVLHGSIWYSFSLIVLFMYIEINLFKVIHGYELLPKVGKMLVFLEQLHFITNMFISWLVTIIHFNKLTDTIKGFSAAEILLQNLNVTIPHSSHLIYQILQIIGFFIIISITSVLDFIMNGLRVGFIIAFCINTIVLIQFLDLVLLYRLYFFILNQQISLVGANKDKNVYRNRNTLESPFNAVNYKNNINFIANIGVPFNINEYSLRVIRETHRFLFSLYSDFNSFFSLQLLCSVSSSILTIIASLYYFALYTISGIDIYHHHYVIGILYTAFTASYNFIKLLALVHICTSTTDQVSNASLLVHSILNDGITPIGVQSELQLFSNQLMHEKVVFTACGFFTLDFTLISTVVGAVSTYMVILIQFQITS